MLFDDLQRFGHCIASMLHTCFLSLLHTPLTRNNVLYMRRPDWTFSCFQDEEHDCFGSAVHRWRSFWWMMMFGCFFLTFLCLVTLGLPGMEEGEWEMRSTIMHKPSSHIMIFSAAQIVRYCLNMELAEAFCMRNDASIAKQRGSLGIAPIS
jgi:hypothetical protein